MEDDSSFFTPQAKRVKASGALVEYEADGIRMTVNHPPPPPEPVIVHTTPVSLREQMQSMNIPNERCWGCEKLRRPTNPERDKHLWKIWWLYDNAKNRMHDDAVYTRIAEYYKSDVEDANRRQGKEAVPWCAIMVQVHFEQHIIDPKFMFTQRMRRLRTFLDTLEDNLMEDTATGKRKVIISNTKSYYDGVALLNSMMKTDLSKLVDIA